jgi:ABC-type phosphate transport system substrate-binding protein
MHDCNPLPKSAERKKRTQRRKDAKIAQRKSLRVLCGSAPLLELFRFFCKEVILKRTGVKAISSVVPPTAGFLSVGKIFLIYALFALQGCSTTRPITDIAPIIRIKGSDTMVILAQRWAEEYMKQHTGIAVYVEGGGSATGIEALIKGEIEICTASRPLQPGEVRRLAQQHRNIGIAFRVAKDGLSIYLHPDNPIRDLSLEQVKGIYTGRIKNWREVGGKDEPIVTFSRTPSSGT